MGLISSNSTPHTNTHTHTHTELVEVIHKMLLDIKARFRDQ